MAAREESRDDEGALALSRWLRTALDEVEAVVARLETETEVLDRPLLLISAAGLTSRRLADRIVALVPLHAADDENGNGSR